MSVLCTNIQSHLLWPSSLGNMTGNTQLAKLQSIQNKCFKLVFKQEPCPRNYYNQSVLRVDELLKLLNMKHGHRVQHSHLPLPIIRTSKTDSVNKSLVKSHRYQTQHKDSLNLPTNCSNWYKSSFLYNSISSYNTIPPMVKNQSQEYLFVSCCKSYLFTGEWNTKNLKHTRLTKD